MSLNKNVMKWACVMLMLAAASAWVAHWQGQSSGSGDDLQRPHSPAEDHSGLPRASRDVSHEAKTILQRDRYVASRMHARFATLHLEPMSSRLLSNIVLATTSERLARLESLTDREILDLERQDIAGSEAFTDQDGQAFREILAKHGLTGNRTDHFHRFIMEVNATWHVLAPQPSQEIPGLPPDARELVREGDARRVLERERLRVGFLALAQEEFAGLNVDVEALFEDILALPKPEGLPPFPWPDDER